MKRIFNYLIVFVLLISCSPNNSEIIESDLVGRWQLIASLADPGDGSGVLEPVEDGEIIEFTENGVLKHDLYFCNGQTETDFETEEDSILFDCGSGELRWRYEFQGKKLVIFPPCIEGCRAEYIRIN